MPGIRLAIAVAGVGVLLALSACGSGSTGLPCAPRAQGRLCIKVFHDGLTVRDAIGYLAASRARLTGHAWRLALASYPCDPGSGSVPSCRPVAVYPGPVRHGDPPLARSCRTSRGTAVTAKNGCDDTLAEELATFGDFAGFRPPKRFSSRVWLCVSEVLVSGPPLAPPARACSQVST